MVTWKRFSAEKAREAEAAVAQVYRAAFAGEPYFEGEEEALRFRANWAAFTAKPGFRFVAASADHGGMVGFACGWSGEGVGAEWVDVLRKNLGSEADLWLRDYFLLGELAVTPDFQRLGHGQILFDALLRNETKRPLLLLTLDVHSPARRFYLRNGFARLGPPVATLPQGPLAAFGKLARTSAPR